jgi:ATP-dependent Clp protease ATP-binding subunit ClpA
VSDRPLIGRHAEAAALAEVMTGRSAWRHAILVGEAGVGKSRLLESVCDTVRSSAVTVVAGPVCRCPRVCP